MQYKINDLQQEYMIYGPSGIQTRDQPTHFTENQQIVLSSVMK
jgi:hypothetical protein